MYAASDPKTNEFYNFKYYRCTRPHLLRNSSTNAERNMPSKTPYFSLIQRRGSKLHSIISDSDSDTKNTEIGTLINVSSKT